MVSQSTEQFTKLLIEAQKGDIKASGLLFSRVYEELKALARRRMRGERQDHTLQPTALVHEVYMRLLGENGVHLASRQQFFFAAAQAMRRILINHARNRRSAKRGGGWRRILLNNVLDLAQDDNSEQILALEDAVSRLEKVSPSVAAVVRLRFYAGLTVDETAEALGISPRTVKREWTYARATLFRELGQQCS